MTTASKRVSGKIAASARPPSSDNGVASQRAKLLAWYDANARDLPWRRTRDPYRVWVSEVMLQQTRVETVLRYYAPFLKRFPSLRTLARAPADHVMAAWSGLGYYRRARFLHAGARAVVERHAGRVPEDAEARRALPGVGRYTAGAIGSIAFGREEPIVDGNVARVFTRLFGIDTPLGRRDTEARLWAEAERLVHGPRPGDLNQAWMELGATVCTRASPPCGECPLRTACRAHAEGAVARLPVGRERRAPRVVRIVAIVATDAAHGPARNANGERGADRNAQRERVWLARAQGNLYGGLWNLPMLEGAGRRAALALLRQKGLDAQLERYATARIDHALTHRVLRVELWRATHTRAERRADLRPHRMERIDQVGVSSLTMQVLACAGLPVAPADSRRARARRAVSPTPAAPDLLRRARRSARSRGAA